MTSADAMRFCNNRNNNWPRRLMADNAATLPRLPVTRCLGVCPQGAHVFANKDRRLNNLPKLRGQHEVIPAGQDGLE